MQQAAYSSAQSNDEIRAKNSNLPGSPFAQHCKQLIPESILKYRICKPLKHKCGLFSKCVPNAHFKQWKNITYDKIE